MDQNSLQSILQNALKDYEGYIYILDEQNHPITHITKIFCKRNYVRSYQGMIFIIDGIS